MRTVFRSLSGHVATGSAPTRCGKCGGHKRTAEETSKNIVNRLGPPARHPARPASSPHVDRAFGAVPSVTTEDMANAMVKARTRPDGSKRGERR
jgi:hypothetical protein